MRKKTDVTKKDQVLERRTSVSANPRSRSLPEISTAAFKQSLQKYCLRQGRRKRPFSVGALDILQFDHVRAQLGLQAAENLNKMVRGVLTKNIRDADKFCMPAPGHFLILMPDTDRLGADRLVSRLSELVTQGHIDLPGKQLSLNCAFGTANSAECEENPAEMLQRLGYELNEETELVRKEPAGVTQLGARSFLGKVGIWMQRYHVLEQQGETVSYPGLLRKKYQALDLWRHNARVELSAITANEPADNDLVETFLKRAKVLQSVNHPGVLGLLDFHADDNKEFYLVHRRIDGTSLEQKVTSEPPTGKQVLDWAQQIANTLVYLQHLLPPLVPPPLAAASLILQANHVVLIDYAIPYVFPRTAPYERLSEEQSLAVVQGRPVAAYQPVIESFARLMLTLLSADESRTAPLRTLLSKLGNGTLPSELNTIFKIRSALKELSNLDRIGALPPG